MMEFTQTFLHPPSLGKGGNVTDLKSSEPDLPKLNTAAEFSLSGIKQSSTLLASAASAKSSADTAASAKTAVLATTKAKTNSVGVIAAKEPEPEPGSQEWLCAEWKEEIIDTQDLIKFMKEELKRDCSKEFDPSFCYAAQERNRNDIPKKEELIKLRTKQIEEQCNGNNKCSPGYILTTSSGCCLASQVTTTGICCPPGRAPAADGTCGCLKGKVFTIADKCEPEYGPRSLIQEEKDILQKVFWDSIDYARIIIKRVKGTGTPKTKGKTITLYDEYKDKTGMKEKLFEGNALTVAGKLVLVHEATHIWQYEKMGHDSSMINDFLAARKMGLKLNSAKFKDLPSYFKALLDFDPNTIPGESLYEWRDKADAKPPIPFAKLDPEEQARLVEEYYKTYQYDINKTFIYIKYVDDAIDYIRHKEKGGSSQRS